MSIEITYLVWTLLLAVVQIFLTAAVKTSVFGLKWNMSARDEPREPTRLTSRLERAQANLFETLPIFIGGVLVVQMMGAADERTALGVQLYFWARLIYVPLYALGVPVIRTLVWAVGFAGLMMVLLALI
ncbi:MAPEG family protein [Brevundimonas sp. 2R-24]|uniref:MAPEG family protein n=1 Tax=Peiella sedimenti TaxID=3061083 RepID=A0ABT8SQJ4_9CAUL|nr:MAPEG family protein [Caulobacteraceae bacterium XZ-24]